MTPLEAISCCKNACGTTISPNVMRDQEVKLHSMSLVFFFAFYYSGGNVPFISAGKTTYHFFADSDFNF
jgi:hypothetical protein